MALTENNHGTGAIRSKKDLRDKKWGKIASASVPFDWSIGFDIDSVLHSVVPTAVVPVKNQGTSESCGGQSGSYLEETLSALNTANFDDKSAKFIYSQIFYPQGGTTLRDILNLIVKKGVCSEALLPSYAAGNPPSEGFMRDQWALSSVIEASASASKGLRYAFVDANIDAYAQAIRDNNGAIMQLDGENNGTWLSLFPKAPVGKNKWSHFLFAGKAKLINGVKHIGVRNSWGEGAGDNGLQWISEAYFKSGNVFQGGVIYQPASVLVAEKTTLITRLIALYQQLINKLMGDTKLKI